MHNPSDGTPDKPKKKKSAVARVSISAVTLGGLIIAGGFLASWVMKARDWIAARMAWDAKTMAWAQLAMVAAGAFALVWASSQKWASKYRWELLIGGAVLLVPLAIDAMGTLMAEDTAAAPAPSSAEAQAAGQYGGFWQQARPHAGLAPGRDARPDQRVIDLKAVAGQRRRVYA